MVEPWLKGEKPKNVAFFMLYCYIPSKSCIAPRTTLNAFTSFRHQRTTHSITTLRTPITALPPVPPLGCVAVQVVMGCALPIPLWGKASSMVCSTGGTATQRG